VRPDVPQDWDEEKSPAAPLRMTIPTGVP